MAERNTRTPVSWLPFGSPSPLCWPSSGPACCCGAC